MQLNLIFATTQYQRQIFTHPYNDETSGVREFLDGQTYQPNLSKMITTQLSDKTVAEKLLRIYTK